MDRTRAQPIKHGLSLRKPAMRTPARYHFSDKRNQFHNATPLARAKLLDGPPRLVAENEHRVAIVFSVHRDRLRACLESIRELHPLLDKLRAKVPECEPYPRPAGWRQFLGGEDIRVTSGPSKLPDEGGQRRSRKTS
jgi:hypothetical protein